MEEQEFDALNEAYWQNALARSRKELVQTRKALEQKDKAHAKELAKLKKEKEELLKKLALH